MKRYARTIICIGAMAILLVAIAATRADEEKMMKMSKDANACPADMKLKCCMMCSPEKMKECGVSEAMAGKCAMMMKTEISPSDPQAMLAMSEKLKLTPEQSEKLKSIAENARKEAAGVLTAEQTEILEKCGKEPANMMEMHKKMHQKMMEKNERNEKRR